MIITYRQPFPKINATTIFRFLTRLDNKRIILLSTSPKKENGYLPKVERVPAKYELRSECRKKMEMDSFDFTLKLKWNLRDQSPRYDFPVGLYPGSTIVE